MNSSPQARASTVVGDRLCIACGYNLVGQAIVREAHYDMLIVRCPECATVASVQEYPLLGRWVNRWGAVLAALWLIVSMALWFGSALAIFGFSIAAAELSADRYGHVLYEKFSAWQSQQAAQFALNAASGQVTGGGSVRVVMPGGSADFSAWWRQQDRAAILRDSGGLFGGFNWILWYLWMWAAIVSVMLGIMWATLLMARGRVALTFWACALVLTAALIGLIPAMDWMATDPGWTHRAAVQQVGPLTMALTLLWVWVWLTMGVIIGRSAARGLIRLMLPPRLRSSLAFLWLADGLDPPRTR